MGKADCTNCKWVTREQITDENQNAIVGEYQYSCHRFPPTAIIQASAPGQFKLGSAFPVVGLGMVCSLHDFPDGIEQTN